MDYLLYILDFLQDFVKSQDFVEHTIYFSLFGICLFLYLFIIYPIILIYLKEDTNAGD